MQKKLLFKILKHVGVLLIVCIVAWILIYFMGHFTTLHPNAYRDMTRSILLVYGLYILFYGLFTLVRKRLPLERVRKISTWWENETPIEAICSSFTIVTAINSIMMVMGYDVPKQGVFAYIHMMTRLLIISCVVVVLVWKDVIQWAKKIEFKINFKTFYQKAHNHIYVTISKLFTILTIVYCLYMIAFYKVIDPEGGKFFYQLLLGILIAITLFVLFLLYRRRRKQLIRKESIHNDREIRSK